MRSYFSLQINNTCKKWKANVETRYLVTDGFSLTYSGGWFRKNNASPSFVRLTSHVEQDMGEFFSRRIGVTTQIGRNYHFLRVSSWSFVTLWSPLFLRTTVSLRQPVTVFWLKNSDLKNQTSLIQIALWPWLLRRHIWWEFNYTQRVRLESVAH